MSLTGSNSLQNKDLYGVLGLVEVLPNGAQSHNLPYGGIDFHNDQWTRSPIL